MTVERFEDLVVWQRARMLTREVYGITRRGAFSRDFGLTGQIQRSAVSIMSNLAEGFERSGPADRLHFYTMAKASCAEVRSQLYVALDSGYVDEATFTSLMTQAEEVGRLAGALCAAISRRVQERNGKR